MPLSKEVLLKYKEDKKIFIESGTYHGDAVQLALDCGFEKVHSMEIYDKLYFECMKRFSNEPKVKIWKGDTSINFSDLMSTVYDNSAIWLDSHCSGNDSSYNPDKPYPLVEELRVIGKHDFNRHTIIMDDVRFWETTEWDMPIELIKNIILEINPYYKFVFEDGFQKDDVLVAYVPKEAPTYIHLKESLMEKVTLENMLYYG